MRPSVVLILSAALAAAQAGCLDLPDPPTLIEADAEVDASAGDTQAPPDLETPDPGPDAAPDVEADADAPEIEGADASDADVEPDAAPDVEGCEGDGDCAPPGPCRLAGTCDPGTGVCNYPPEEDGTACDDGDPCTVDDACEAGACVGAEKDCADGVSCTEDTCLATGACLNDTSGCACVADADCDDEDPCTGEETCDAFVCVDGADVDCSHLDGPCVDGVCSPATGECTTSLHTPGSGCDDGDPCTLDDACDGADCEGTPNPCDDDNPCTADSCEAGTGACLHETLEDGTPCDDGDPCTTADTCNGGACLALDAVDWSSGWESGIDGLGTFGATVLADSASEFSTYGAFQFSNEVAVAPTGGAQVLSPVGGTDVALVRYGPTGDVDWIRQFGTDDDERLEEVVALSDGSVVAILEHGAGVVLPGSAGDEQIQTATRSMVRYAASGEPVWVVGIGVMEVQGAFTYPDVGLGVVACTGASAEVVGVTKEVDATVPAPEPGWLDCYLLRWNLDGLLLASPRLILSTSGQVDGLRLDTGTQHDLLATQVVLGWTLEGDARIPGDGQVYEQAGSTGRFVALTRLDAMGELTWGAFVTGSDSVQVGGLAYARLSGDVVATFVGHGVMQMSALDGVLLAAFEGVEPPNPEVTASCLVHINEAASTPTYTICDSPGPLLAVGAQANGSVIRLLGLYSGRFKGAADGTVYAMSAPGVAYLMAADDQGVLFEAHLEPVSPIVVDQWRMLAANHLLGVTMGGTLDGNVFTLEGTVSLRSLELGNGPECADAP